MAKKPISFTDLIGNDDFSKLFESMKSSTPFDLKAILEIQRKNIEAVTEAQQRSTEGIQALAKRQSEILSRMVEDQSALVQEIVSESSPETKMAKNAEMFKDAYERSIDNMRELSELISKSTIDSSDIINKRVSATMSEIQDSLEQDKDKAKTKAA